MLYSYEAFNKSGASVSGEVDVASEKDVIAFLESKELIPSRIREKDKKKKLDLASIRVFEKASRTDVIFLLRNVKTALKAGLSIVETLDILITDAKSGLMKDILVSARSTVQGGRPISEAFAHYPNVFSSVVVGLLKAGEGGSQLDKALQELISHLVKEDALIRKIKAALVYPTMLFVASIGVTTFLLVFVLPKLSKTFLSADIQLPAITKLLLAASQFMSANILVLAILGALALFGIISLSKTPKGKRLILQILFKTPVVKDLMKKVALVRFTRTLGSLLGGGTPILDALRTCSDSVGNDFYREAILDSLEKIRGGMPLSKSLKTYPDLFPELLTSLSSVGERTGSIEYVLQTFSEFYDEEVDAKLKDLTTLFEPILLLFMGLIVGTVALSVLLPIYQLVGKFT